MRVSVVVCLGVLFVCAAVCAQMKGTDPGFIRSAVIKHYGTHATVEANSARPMFQAITAFREEYGLRINFEDPPYFSQFDLVQDGTSPHIIWGVVGGAFQSDYPETAAIRSSASEQLTALQIIVTNYNQSSLPGKFEVRQDPDGSFTVVGIGLRDNAGNVEYISPYLDTQLPAGSLLQAPYALLSALTAKTGTQVVPSGISPLAFPGQISIGGNNLRARDILAQICASASKTVQWDLRYDPTARRYILDVVPVVRAQYDTFGGKTTVPVGQQIFGRRG
jgi:hypothetical protein